MDLRHDPRLRAIAKKLPIISGYERRIAELTELANDQSAALAQAGDWSERLEKELVAARSGSPDPGPTAGEAPEPPGPTLFVPPGHFYSPIPSLEEVEERRAVIFDRDPAEIAGVDLRLAEQWSLLDELQPLSADVDLPVTEDDARRRGLRYWTDNPAYAAGDGLFLSLLLRWARPSRMIELGCGFSSACTLDARDRWLDGRPELTFVDPYPHVLDSLIRDSDRAGASVLVSRSQDLDLDLVRTLAAGDVLFVDSTHITKTGSDVNAVFFDLLPALAEGVIVHVHDMFPGFEYPEAWVMEGRAWNELYLVRAFLQYNRDFEILLWPSLLAGLERQRMFEMFPAMRANVGGSLWLRRVGTS